MKRREFIAGLGGVAVWPIAAQAQQTTKPVIGYLAAATYSPASLAAFHRAVVYHEIETQSVFHWVMEPTRLLLLPMVIKLHPGLAKELLSCKLVFYRGTLFVHVAVIVLAVILLTDWRLLLVPAAAFGTLAVYRAGSLSPLRLIKTAAKTLLSWMRTAVLRLLCSSAASFVAVLSSESNLQVDLVTSEKSG